MIKKQLNEDQRKADEEFLIAGSPLFDATKRFHKTIFKEDILGIKLGKEMSNTTNKKNNLTNKHKNAQNAVRKTIGEKRKKILAEFM